MRLNLVRNLLTDVPTEALLILKNLNQLDLSDNKIKTLQSRNGGRIFEGKACIQHKGLFRGAKLRLVLISLACSPNQM